MARTQSCLRLIQHNNNNNYEETEPKTTYPHFEKDDYHTPCKRILCGRFAEKLRNNFAVGDEDNNLSLYNLSDSKPVVVLNPQTSNNVSSVTSLTFTQSDD